MWKPNQPWRGSQVPNVTLNSTRSNANQNDPTAASTAPLVDFKNVHPSALQGLGTIVGAVSQNIDLTSVVATLTSGATIEIDSDLISIPNMNQVVIVDVEFFTKEFVPGVVGFTAGDSMDISICLIVGPGPVTILNLVNVLCTARVFAGIGLFVGSPPPFISPNPFTYTGTGKCSMAYAGLTTGPTCDGQGGGLDPAITPNYDATIAVIVTPTITNSPLISQVHIATARVLK